MTARFTAREWPAPPHISGGFTSVLSASGVPKGSDDLAVAGADSRAQLRSSMFLAAVMRAGSEQSTVKIRNMSSHGAMVESSVTPAVGSEVNLIRGALVCRGTVMWRSPDRCGLRFTSEVFVKDWLAAPTKAQQQRVDDIVALVKAGAADLSLGSDDPHEARSHEQIVDDLAAVVRLMQDLGDDLAASEETLERHGMKLQNLDIAMQMMRAVASELTSGGASGSGSIARLKDLRVACAQALSAG